jgi:hypothetical protein
MFQTDDPRQDLLNALSLLPGHPRAERDAIESWLNALPAPRLGQWPDMALAASVTLDQKRLTLRAAGATQRMAASTRAFLQQAGGAQEELARLDMALAQLDPLVLGSWLEIGPQGVDGGWFLPSPMQVSDAISLLPEGDAVNAVLLWAAEHEIDVCLGVRRSVNAAAPYADLTLPLPDGQAHEQLAAALLLFDAMGAPTLPEALRRAIMRDLESPLAISAWLLPEGLAQLSVLIHDPSEELLTAAGIACGVSAEGIRPFVNACGPGQVPMALEIQRTAEGLQAELHLEVREAEPPN